MEKVVKKATTDHTNSQEKEEETNTSIIETTDGEEEQPFFVTVYARVRVLVGVRVPILESTETYLLSLLCQ